MKRINNIYNDIVDIKKIQLMYNKRVKLNTKNKQKLEKFENNYVSNMIYIKNILAQKQYKPGKYNIFIIKEPKIRLIMSQNIIDKLINHMVSEYFLVKVFDKTFIKENIATRKDKGTHYGIKLLKKYLNELKDEEFYILKFDISKYFFNIDHDISKRLIREKIKDVDALKLLDEIIDTTDLEYINKIVDKVKKNEVEKVRDRQDSFRLIADINKLPYYQIGKGLPIGNMSSQVIAILYLNELDHYIKENLNIKYYIRYMDDGIILHKDKEYLKYCLKEISKIIEKYKLKLNEKTRIISSKQGFEFLGFRYNIKNNKIIMKTRNQTKRRFKRKMKNLYKLVENNNIKEKDLLQIKASYLGHLSYGNCNNLIIKNIKENNENIEIEVKRAIIENEKIVYK